MSEMYEKAGKIVSKVRGMAVDYIDEDMKVLDLVKFVEGNIVELGGAIAFPCNVSINEITAHYTSPEGDETRFKRGDLVKIDLGAHVDGYIADSAISVLVGMDNEGDASPENSASEDVDMHFKMIETAQEALGNAISTVRDGVEIGKIGTVIEETINNKGLKSVSNLTGHSMDQWILHAGISVPNVREKNDHKIEEGDVLAIEPFVTNGVGRVGDMKDAYIFKFLRDRPLRMHQARKLLDTIEEDYRNLPFAGRWIMERFNGNKNKLAMRKLISSRAIYPYHVLKEKSDAWVAQAEHTVIVESDGCKVITE
jgi:methionyl aminopeptidase